jgi:hypothetical protein
MANRDVPVIRRSNRNAPLLLLVASLIDSSHSLQILSTAQALLLSAPSFLTAQSPPTTSSSRSSSSKSKSSYYSSSTSTSSSSSSSPPSSSSAYYDVPALQLSAATARVVNGAYEPRDPDDIPPGFARMCGRAGGFAPRPVWDSATNGVTPWFESREGCYVWYNRDESHWYVDDPHGAGMYLANPEGSLLLPPTAGWVSLTGRRAGAPRMSFV